MLGIWTGIDYGHLYLLLDACKERCCRWQQEAIQRLWRKMSQVTSPSVPNLMSPARVPPSNPRRPISRKLSNCFSNAPIQPKSSVAPHDLTKETVRAIVGSIFDQFFALRCYYFLPIPCILPSQHPLREVDLLHDIRWSMETKKLTPVF